MLALALASFHAHAADDARDPATAPAAVATETAQRTAPVRKVRRYTDSLSIDEAASLVDDLVEASESSATRERSNPGELAAKPAASEAVDAVDNTAVEVTPARRAPIGPDGAAATSDVAATEDHASNDGAENSETESIIDRVAEIETIATAEAASLKDAATPLMPIPDLETILTDPRAVWRRIRPQLELTAQQIPDLARGALADLKVGRITRRAEVLAGLMLSTLLALLLCASRAVRGRGNVVVCIEYPLELRGTFSVKLAKRSRENSKAGQLRGPEDVQHAKRKTTATRHVVSRETQFRDVRARRYYIIVDGFLQSANGDEVISTHNSEHLIVAKAGDTAHVAFDFNPHACPVEVRVLWDKRPVQEAQVARWGAPGSMRFARGSVQYTLDRGQHTLVVGSGDRVAEVPVEVTSFQPIELVVDMADRAHLLFTGCPPAVETYLAGDVPAAARSLERDGQTQVAHRLLARFHQESGQRESAAKHFEEAEMWLEAAELRQSLTEFEKAAHLYEKSGDDERAGEMFRSAGKLLRAGDAYARADSYDSAVECFKNAGDMPRWIDALSKMGENFEAAKVAMENSDSVRAIQCLNRVVVGDPNYPEATVRLAEVYEQEEHPELAIHKLEELVACQGHSGAPIIAVDMLARILEGSGEYERALQVLERLRGRDASFPNISTRIEYLRKRSSKANSSAMDLATAGSAADAFSQEFRYEILEEVGRGGMGIVFKARDRRLGRVVALKRLPDNLSDHPKAVELFLREARAAAALNHLNIVTLFDAGQEGDTFFITMELLEGLPLQKILQSRKRLNAPHVIKLGGQIATGLQYAHEEGIVHRDIKTANLFFTNKKTIKIMDFGLAKMTEEVRRSTTVIGGTPYYMAPEQSAGERVDHRADLYALGVTFYELLVGRVPFREGDVAFHHRHTQPPDPRDEAPGIPDAIAALVLKLLEKRPADRIQSAGEVCEQLQHIARSLN